MALGTSLPGLDRQQRLEDIRRRKNALREGASQAGRPVSTTNMNNSYINPSLNSNGKHGVSPTKTKASIVVDRDRDRDMTHDWELIKENAAPLARGRNISRLSKALGAGRSGEIMPNGQFHSNSDQKEKRKASFENLISFSEDNAVAAEKVGGDPIGDDDDPLVIWLSYIKWVQDEYNPSDTRESFLLLERCTRAFLRVARYRNDVRFIRVCVTYADKTTCPASVFKFLHQHRVGTKTTLFWIAWAWVAEKVKDFSFADKVFSKGKSVGAEPYALLEQRHKQFQRRMARHFLDQNETQNVDNAHSDTLCESRGAYLSHLSTEDESSNYRGRSHRSVDRDENGQSIRSGLGRSRTDRNRTEQTRSFRRDGSLSTHVGGSVTNGVRTGDGFSIFVDENAIHGEFDFDTTSTDTEIPRNLQTEAHKKKENEEKPDRWNSRGGIAQSTSPAQTRTSKESSVGFSVFVDDENKTLAMTELKLKKDESFRNMRSLRQILDSGTAEKLVHDPLRYVNNPEKLLKDKVTDKKVVSAKVQKVEAIPKIRKSKDKKRLKSEDFQEYSVEEKRAAAKCFRIDTSSENFSIFERKNEFISYEDDYSVEMEDASFEAPHKTSFNDLPSFIDKSESRNPRRVLFDENLEVTHCFNNNNLNDSNASSDIDERDAVGGLVRKDEETMHTKLASLELSTMFHSPDQLETKQESILSKPFFSMYANDEKPAVRNNEQKAPENENIRKRKNERVNFVAGENFVKRPAVLPPKFNESNGGCYPSENQNQILVFEDNGISTPGTVNSQYSSSPCSKVKNNMVVFSVFEDSKEICKAEVFSVSENAKETCKMAASSGFECAGEKGNATPFNIFEDTENIDAAAFSIFEDDKEKSSAEIFPIFEDEKKEEKTALFSVFVDAEEKGDAAAFSVFEDNCPQDSLNIKTSIKNCEFDIFCDDGGVAKNENIDVEDEEANKTYAKSQIKLEPSKFQSLRQNRDRDVSIDEDCVKCPSGDTNSKIGGFEIFCDENDHSKVACVSKDVKICSPVNPYVRAEENGDTATFSVFEDAVKCFSDGSPDVSNFMACKDNGELKVFCENGENNISGDKYETRAECNSLSLSTFASGNISRIVDTDSSLIENGFVSSPNLTISDSLGPKGSIVYDDIHSADVLNSLQVLMDEIVSGLGLRRKDVSDDTIEWCSGDNGPIGDRRSIILPRSLFNKRAMLKAEIMLDGVKMTCVRELGAGSNATVLLCRKEETASEPREIAVKVQSPTGCLAWEYIILRELDSRLKHGQINSNFIPKPFSFHAYSNGSLLGMTAGSQHGTNLLDIVNIHKSIGGSHGVPELLVIHYTARMIQHLIHLHCEGQVLHCDIKPDNWVLAPGSNDDESFLGIEGADLMLVDFGRAVDLKPIKNNFEEIKLYGDAAGEDMACIAMKENQSWCYDIDIFGLLSSAHVLLFGAHMEVFKDSANSWRIKKSIRRYWKADLWNSLFVDLLNNSHIDEMMKILELFNSHL
eukprot:CAMPEP_0194316520 /NCGR_PEP_ID=MMETSP0171-20130528/13316_1 /TAXON_ID=218684 /ORGANISM="Corethron pennatum, Strain L29A3" /LENGTH=1492 /DNA_ID=CAMNT_0039072789 /DNA_START=93 /DNA_END=4568 /DNA_ORIENTATION=-